jgi:hypothetical protein
LEGLEAQPTVDLMTATLTKVFGEFMCLLDPNMDEIIKPKAIKFNSEEEY